MAKIELITGPERRRLWSEASKRELVARAFAPGAIVQNVARQSDVAASLLYRWRREFRRQQGFAQIVVADPPPPTPPSTPPSHQLEIILPDGTQLRVAADIAPQTLRRLVGALRR
jgi:transposase